jgi:hypothetical protein
MHADLRFTSLTGYAVKPASVPHALVLTVYPMLDKVRKLYVFVDSFCGRHLLHRVAGGFRLSKNIGNISPVNQMLTRCARSCAMPKVWKICVRPDPELPDTRQGYALAETQAEAVYMAGVDHVLAFPTEKLWPAGKGQIMSWSN